MEAKLHWEKAGDGGGGDCGGGRDEGVPCGQCEGESSSLIASLQSLPHRLEDALNRSCGDRAKERLASRAAVPRNQNRCIEAGGQ